MVFIAIWHSHIVLEPRDARHVAETLGNNLIGVSHDAKNFARLPDRYWGYYARGHDSKGAFGIIVSYSEDADDVDNLLAMYEKWTADNKQRR